MTTLNAVEPTPDQIKTFLASHEDGVPIYMLNLLKFKQTSTYSEGEQVSGAQAYARYAKAFGQMLRDQGLVGVETIFGGKVDRFLIGEGADAWDAVAIVRYPDKKSMFDAVSNETYRSFHFHRKAGLEGQLLIACDGSGVF
ncbi:DUF1330 domain-containing protein [Algimonas arctica]|uniref:DUF1330 domain-containing protein n=1 Tax=Algimonas arctica TaxID=1479486 RepID=A0A8J3CUU2_9PROT|nr:DUF1330 domain-containing protein [Algimonas arctica]GHB04460.1 DUF1330 domain-containing protein [Algimonas arctica]